MVDMVTLTSNNQSLFTFVHTITLQNVGQKLSQILPLLAELNITNIFMKLKISCSDWAWTLM